MKILISAFDPFNGRETNISKEVLELLSSDFDKAQLPTSYERSFIELRKKIDSIRPDLILMLGESSQAVDLEIERVAINFCDCSIPDNDEIVLKHSKISHHSRDLLESNLDFEKLSDFKISYHAGTYVCNCLFYKTLNYLESSSLESLATFVHLPTKGDVNSLCSKIESLVETIRT